MFRSSQLHACTFSILVAHTHSVLQFVFFRSDTVGLWRGNPVSDLSILSVCGGIRINSHVNIDYIRIPQTCRSPSRPSISLGSASQVLSRSPSKSLLLAMEWNLTPLPFSGLIAAICRFVLVHSSLADVVERAHLFLSLQLDSMQ